MTIFVNCRENSIEIDGNHFPCRIGRNGYIDYALGREGDGKTPLGDYTMRFGFYRPDRLPPPPSRLKFIPLRDNDGWCDDPKDPAYNRFVRLPYQTSHEKLWRDDSAYDIIVVLSHNDSPPQPNMGSAIFVHIAQPDDRKTLGCIALDPDTMVKFIQTAEVGKKIIIQT